MAASEREETGMQTPSPTVLESKLYPATGALAPLDRARLDPPPRFREGVATVATIVAPAGYGKSTLMARWHAQLRGQGVACAWLNLDDGDNDATRCVGSVVAAFQALVPQIGKGALTQLAASGGSDPRAALESLAGDLARLAERTVVFLDDLHVLQDEASRATIDWLVNYSPKLIQYVLGSREEIALRLGSLRVQGRLVEVEARNLQFTAEEAADFCSRRLGASLPESELRSLIAKTEGWPAALELATLALEGAADHANLIARFAGSDRDVVDYLGDVLLRRLDPELRRFACGVALFDRFDASLAAAALQTTVADAQARLSDLHRRRLFLVALDRGGRWFRFHQLIGEFLSHAFAADGEPVGACVLRGARWLWAQGEVEAAIDAAIRARAFDEATAWVAEAVEDLIYRRGYHQTILRWMNALPANCVDRYPTIRIHYAFALAFSPRQTEVDAQLHRLRAICDDLAAKPAPDLALIAEIRCALELQASISTALRDDGVGARDQALAWMERWPDADPLRRGSAASALAFGYKTAGDLDAGLAAVHEARSAMEQADGWYHVSWNVFVEAMILMKRGDYLGARRVCKDGLEICTRHLGGHPVQGALMHSALGAIAYEFDETAVAASHLEQAMSHGADYAPADAAIMAYLTQARLLRLRGDVNGALAVLREGQEIGERRRLERLCLMLAAEECTWLCRQERFEEAKTIAARHGFDRVEAGGHDMHTEKGFRVASRYVVRQSPGSVIAALTPALERCRERGFHRRRVELLTIKAIAHRYNAEPAAASACLVEALGEAAPRGYLRMFLDDLDELAPVIEKLGADAIRGTEAGAMVRRLRQALEDADRTRASSGAAKKPALVEELSKREIVILKRLESGMSNREIAESLFITEGTLKWHLTNVYGKLAVKNRAGAMVKAKGLGLI
jgi:ATP/maltotriose-dependent transcriptional regulator MalT